MKKLLFILLVLILTCNFVQARYIQTSNIRFKSNNGYSKYYTVDVTFYSGNELNNITKTYNYDNYGKYATVFWSQEQVSIIKITSFLTCSSNFTKSCLNDLSNMQGIDQNNVYWEICTGTYCS